MLREQFPTLSMALIHKALGYYRERKDDLEAESDRIQARIDSARASGGSLDLDSLRARLAEKVTAARPG